MNRIDEYLLDDEQIQGNYNIEIARWSNGRFTTTVPALYATITDMRMVLVPQTRKRYEPASIHGSIIANIEPLDSVRPGICLRLTTGQCITMFLPVVAPDTFKQQLNALTKSDKTYNVPLSLTGLQRLIAFFEDE